MIAIKRMKNEVMQSEVLSMEQVRCGVLDVLKSLFEHGLISCSYQGFFQRPEACSSIPIYFEALLVSAENIWTQCAPLALSFGGM